MFGSMPAAMCLVCGVVDEGNMRNIPCLYQDGQPVAPEEAGKMQAACPNRALAEVDESEKDFRGTTTLDQLTSYLPPRRVARKV